MNHRRRFTALVLALVVAGAALGACGEKHEGLPLGTTPFQSLFGGYTIRYPEGWQCYEGSGVGLFFESMDSPGAGDGTSPFIMTSVQRREDLVPTQGDTMDSRAILEALARAASEGGGTPTVGEPWNLRVGGKEAIAADFSGSSSGAEVAGRVIFVEMGERGAMIVGFGEAKAWSEFVPTFEAMVASMVFK